MDGLAALSAMLAAVACQATAPPTMLPVGSAAAVASEAPVAIEASASVEALPSELTPFTSWLLDEDVGSKLHERAWLSRLGTVRVQREDTERFADGFDELTMAREVVVVAQRGEFVRFVHEASTARMLLWARREAFELITVRPTQLAVQPGVYPQGPVGTQESDGIGVWLPAGSFLRPTQRRDGWREIKLSDHSFEAQGWLDESQLGTVSVPGDVPEVRTHAAVLTGTSLVAAPGGPALGRFPSSPGEPPTEVRWVDEAGPAPRGFRFVQYGGYLCWARGLIPAARFVPPEPRRGYGRGRGGTMGRGSRQHHLPLALEIEAGTALWDGPRGEMVGRVLKPLLIPDRIERQAGEGRRRVEVPMAELGAVKVWVEERALRPYSPPAPASASASASARRP